MTPRFDILGIGVLAVDDIIHVARYPAADEKQPVLHEERVLGGLVGTALAAAAKLGARCAYAGALGDDDLSAAAKAGLSAMGVDTSAIFTQKGAGPVHSIIIADDAAHTRNIFFNEQRVAPPPASAITPDLVSRAKVLLVDQVMLAAVVAACRSAKQAGVPSVADVEARDPAAVAELMPLVDQLIVPRSFAALATGAAEPAEMVRRLSQTHARLCTAVTCGSEGCFYAATDGVVRHKAAYRVTAVDTTGCGDVFHGAYAWALSQGKGVPECIATASAAAAAFASRPAGWKHLPGQSDLTPMVHEAR